MKKISFAWFCAMLITLYSCKKEVTNKLETSAASNYLPGPCPYDCHDTRCQAYLNGYCGSSMTAPNMLPQAQAIALVGQVHNDGLSYIANHSDLTFVDGTTNANRAMSAILSFYSAFEGGMTVTNKNAFISITAEFYNKKVYYNSSDCHPLDSVIQSQFALIAPTRSLNELNIINNAKNIFHFNFSGMTFGQICDNVIARANAVLTQYNSIGWNNGSGDCAGGYLQIILKSATFWKYVNDNNAVPPMSTGGQTDQILNPNTLAADQSMLQIPRFLRWLGALNPIQADAAGYLWGWGKSYFGGEPSQSKRIYEGATEALHSSTLGLLK
jgi:hypothetical protein